MYCIVNFKLPTETAIKHRLHYTMRVNREFKTLLIRPGWFPRTGFFKGFFLDQPLRFLGPVYHKKYITFQPEDRF